jgi:hypothetical protein
MALNSVAPRPTVVCLCGSTRFIDAFRQAEFDETLAGRIVLTIGCDTKSDDMLNLGPDVKERLDELHKRKIDLADEVLILNVGGYVGKSTHSELVYAREHGKRVRWLVDFGVAHDELGYMRPVGPAPRAMVRKRAPHLG